MRQLSFLANYKKKRWGWQKSEHFESMLTPHWFSYVPFFQDDSQFIVKLSKVPVYPLEINLFTRLLMINQQL